jgi:pentatricopeptide repeat protein
MIHMYAKKNDKKNCFRLFNEMKQNNIDPNSFTYLYLLKSFIYRNGKISLKMKEMADNLIIEIKNRYDINNPGFQTIMHNSHSLKGLINQIQDLQVLTPGFKKESQKTN